MNRVRFLRRDFLRRRIAGVRDDGRQPARLAFAHDADVHLVADAEHADGIAQLGVGFDVLAVHGRDDVTRPNSRLVRWRAFHHLRDERARRVPKPVELRDVRRHVVDAHAEQAAVDRAELQQLVHHAVGHVHRDREADADVAATARQDRGVDADELTLEIHERAPGGAGIDGGIRLDEILEAIRVDAGAGKTADDA